MSSHMTLRRVKKLTGNVMMLRIVLAAEMGANLELVLIQLPMAEV